ncbi:MAG: hypothetical protein ACD_12C00445G0001, partial [uncultured bacterium]
MDWNFLYLAAPFWLIAGFLTSVSTPPKENLQLYITKRNKIILSFLCLFFISLAVFLYKTNQNYLT